MEATQRLTTSQKVHLALFNQKKTRTWLAEQMQITRMTLGSRIDNNDWSLGEVLLLKQLLNIE
jgi:hypothetical protein